MADVVTIEKSAQQSTYSTVETVESLEIRQKYLTKLDVRLIPILGCTYTLLFLDRTNIANARIEGLEKDLNMPSNGYATCVWIFFIPFVLVEIPSNLIMSLPRVKPNLFLGANMLVLGIVSTCQGLTHSYQGLLALRFLMGILEATLPAGAAFLIGEYYTSTQSPLRYAYFFCFALLGPSISGLLAYGIRNMDGIENKAGWRWIFIIEGILTIITSFFVFVLVPDFPEKAKFLQPDEKAHLLQQLHADKGDQKLDLKTVNWTKTLVDYKIWFPTLIFFCADMTAASMSAFMPTILTELGWKASSAQLMSVPVWVNAMVFQVIGCWIAGRSSWRGPFILIGIVVTAIGWSIQMVFAQNQSLAAGVRYVALFCMSGGTFIQMAMATSWMTSNLRGRASLAVGTATILGIGNCANFVASNVFFPREAPYYRTGFATGLGLTLTGAVVCGVFMGLLWLHNKKLEQKREGSADEKGTSEYAYQI